MKLLVANLAVHKDVKRKRKLYRETFSKYFETF